MSYFNMAFGSAAPSTSALDPGPLRTPITAGGPTIPAWQMSVQSTYSAPAQPAYAWPFDPSPITVSNKLRLSNSTTQVTYRSANGNIETIEVVGPATDPALWTYYERVEFWRVGDKGAAAFLDNHFTPRAAQIADAWIKKFSPDTLNLIVNDSVTINSKTTHLADEKDDASRKQILIRVILNYFQTLIDDPGNALVHTPEQVWDALYGEALQAAQTYQKTSSPTAAIDNNIELTGMQSLSHADQDNLNNYTAFITKHTEIPSEYKEFLQNYFVLQDRKTLTNDDAYKAAQIISAYGNTSNPDDQNMAGSLYLRANEALFDNNNFDQSSLSAAMQPLITKGFLSESAIKNTGSLVLATAALGNTSMNAVQFIKNSQALDAAAKQLLSSPGAAQLLPPTTLANVVKISPTAFNSLPLTDSQIAQTAEVLDTGSSRSTPKSSLILPLLAVGAYFILRSKK